MGVDTQCGNVASSTVNTSSKCEWEVVRGVSMTDMESIHLPLPKRYPPVGLKNWGNTCYANAALQCLLSTALVRALTEPKCVREFKRYSSNVDLLDEVLQPEQDGNHLQLHQSNSCGTIGTKNLKANSESGMTYSRTEDCIWLTRELRALGKKYTGDPSKILNPNDSAGTLFSYIFDVDRPVSIDPGNITRNVTRISKCLRVGRQEDAHEFLRALISTLVMDGNNKKLSSLFDGLMESAVTCQVCGNASLTRDRYMDVSLDINGTGIKTLNDAFERFTSTELLSPDNMVTCDRCNVKRRVTKGLRLATAPTILVLHFKRFAYDIFGRLVRLHKKVDFPTKLNISDYMSHANRSKPFPYELVSVLVHRGKTCNSGHYLSYVKSDGEWYCVNDEQVEKVHENVVLAQRAYILVYEVEGMRNHKIRHPYFDDRSVEDSLSTASQMTFDSTKTHKSGRSDPTPLTNSFLDAFASCGLMPSDLIPPEFDCLKYMMSQDEGHLKAPSPNKVYQSSSFAQSNAKEGRSKSEKRQRRLSMKGNIQGGDGSYHFPHAEGLKFLEHGVSSFDSIQGIDSDERDQLEGLRMSSYEWYNDENDDKDCSGSETYEKNVDDQQNGLKNRFSSTSTDDTVVKVSSIDKYTIAHGRTEKLHAIESSDGSGVPGIGRQPSTDSWGMPQNFHMWHKDCKVRGSTMLSTPEGLACDVAELSITHATLTGKNENGFSKLDAELSSMSKESSVSSKRKLMVRSSSSGNLGERNKEAAIAYRDKSLVNSLLLAPHVPMEKKIRSMNVAKFKDDNSSHMRYRFSRRTDSPGLRFRSSSPSKLLGKSIPSPKKIRNRRSLSPGNLLRGSHRKSPSRANLFLGRRSPSPANLFRQRARSNSPALYDKLYDNYEALEEKSECSFSESSFGSDNFYKKVLGRRLCGKISQECMFNCDELPPIPTK